MSEAQELYPSPNLTVFESIRHLEEDGAEWWTARELARLLGYKLWQNFDRVINEAKKVCSQEAEGAVENNL